MKELKVDIQSKKVYDTIFKHGKKKDKDFFISYAKISQVTGIQSTMVSSILRNLTSNGVLNKMNHFNETGGLKANSYQSTNVVPVAPEPVLKAKNKKMKP